jgi:hypothetical protein
MIPMVAFKGVEVAFVAGNGAMFPDPELANPIAWLLFVHA